jgi:hypothetical protein
MVAYDAKSHQLLGAGGVSSSLSDDNNLFVMGIGPFQSGTARRELQETTVRQVNEPNQSLPTTVAFNANFESASEKPERLQLTGSRQSDKE